MAILAAHHGHVKALLADLAELCRQNVAGGHKSALIDAICHDLALHNALAQELFFPAARLAFDDAMLVDAALAGRSAAGAVVGQLRNDPPEDPSYVPKITSLDALLGRQFALEEEMFDKLRSSDLDAAGLGLLMADRKLMLEHAHQFDGARWVELMAH